LDGPLLTDDFLARKAEVVNLAMMSDTAGSGVVQGTSAQIGYNSSVNMGGSLLPASQGKSFSVNQSLLSRKRDNKYLERSWSIISGTGQSYQNQ